MSGDSSQFGIFFEDFKSPCKTVNGNEGDKCHYPTRIDTYGKGCQHDCSYCYAKSLLNFRQMWNPKKPAIADLKDIRKQITHLRKGQVVRLGGMTDCFMPMEDTVRNTFYALQMLKQYKVPYLIVTKSDMVARGDYLAVLDKDLAHIQITVTTFDDDLCRTYEKAVPPSRRIKAIEKLQELGYDISLRLSPYIPQYVDINRLNDVKVDKIVVEFLRVNAWIKKWFDIDYSDYTITENGYQHLPLEKKIEYISKIKNHTITVCEDQSDAYDYWTNHFNPNKNDCCNLKI